MDKELVNYVSMKMNLIEHSVDGDGHSNEDFGDYQYRMAEAAIAAVDEYRNKQSDKMPINTNEKQLMDFVMDVTLGYNPDMVRGRMSNAIAKHFPTQNPSLCTHSEMTESDGEGHSFCYECGVHFKQ